MPGDFQCYASLVDEHLVRGIAKTSTSRFGWASAVISPVHNAYETLSEPCSFLGLSTTLRSIHELKMSYYFAIIGTRDNPLFEIDFGTSKGNGDGTSHFKKEARHMNQFIVHAALDSVDDTQWTTKELQVSHLQELSDSREYH